MTTPPPERCDVAVVGAGILGLAAARELLLRRPDLHVAVVEREADVGEHQTSHSSGVIHAGIYYAPGSLKARLCVEGARLLYEYCDQRAIPYERCGKLIIASTDAELAGLDELERRGTANGVGGLRRLRGTEIADVEPHATGAAALHSPATGVVDFGRVARALADELRELGASVATGVDVTRLQDGARSIRLLHNAGATEAGYVLACAGAWSDRLAVAAGADPDPRIIPFRGGYLTVRPERRSLVRGLIYPVPNPALPFLGVHLTRHIDGDLMIGPTALLVAARDAYDIRRVNARDLGATLAWPGTWRMMRRFWRAGLEELRHAVRTRSLVRAAAGYVPELRRDDVEQGPAGVRAQALWRDGRLADDFVFSRTPRALHVRNAPSPAATSSLAIARAVVDEAEAAFELEPGRRRPQLRG